MNETTHNEFVLPEIDADAPIGQRLAAAREARAWTVADVGSRLKLPVKLIQRLERGDYAGMTQGVFLHGYLSSYARLVGVPVDVAARAAVEHTEAPPLVATGTVSRSRYLFDRYSVSATYLALTAIIVVPAVWLATHGGLEQNLARTTPLDPPSSLVASANEESAGTESITAEAKSGPIATSAQSSDVGRELAPVIASMAPFVGNAASSTAPTPAAVSTDGAATLAPATTQGPDAVKPAISGMHTLQLKLSQQSWVEMTAADGRKLEYGMLAAGTEHEYSSDGPVTLRIGNAQAAQIQIDGKAIELGAYQHGNVARLTLFGNAATGDAPAVAGQVEQGAQLRD